MARAWQIEFDEALYHVLSQGNEHQAIFRDDQDRTRFFETVGEMAFMGKFMAPYSLLN